MQKKYFVLLLTIAYLSLLSCSSIVNKPTQLDPQLAWYGQNRERLNAMIAQYGGATPAYVAVFDFDNTCIKNDMGDITTFWMINHSLIFQPPAKDWTQVSPLLSVAARMALNSACDALAQQGEALPTGEDCASCRACADELAAIYSTEKTVSGEPGFTQGADDYIQPSYALAAQLQAGYTPEEMRAIARHAAARALNSAIGATQKVGSTEGFNAYLRTYDQIKDLMKVMQNTGIDVWIVSASSQYVVESLSERFGIAADHVIGIRTTLDANGKFTRRFQAAGPFNDGNGQIISYRDGKRYWINKVIFGVSDPVEQTKHVNQITDRLLFVAGDSPTDLSMLRDAVYKLVINRNKTELMCYAYDNDNGQGHWLINPMFIEPMPRKQSGYVCAEWGLPDQQDTNSD